MKNPTPKAVQVLVLHLLLLLPSLTRATEPLDSWTVRHPTAGSGSSRLERVAYGNGAYVAVGQMGTILVSPDGVAWIEADSGSFEDLSNVTFGNGLFVAVGAFGEILTSGDGFTWSRGLVATLDQITSVAAGGGVFVAVSNDGILRSTDGIIWSMVLSGTTGDMLPCYGNGVFVLVGYSGVLTSVDGLSWVRQNSSIRLSPNDLTFGGGRFVAVSGGSIYTSTNATAWSVSTFTNVTLSGVAYGGGRYVAVGNYAQGTVVTSGDGIHWNRESAVQSRLRAVTHGANGFLALGGTASLLTSMDGAIWLNRTTVTENSLSSVAFGGGRFVAVGYGGEVVTSTNGVVWARASTPTNLFLSGVAFGNGRFVAIDEYNTGLLFSTNGIDWVLRSRPSGNIQAVTYGGGLFLAVGYGVILASPDGENWASRNSGHPSLSLSTVTFGNGIFVAAGQNGILLTSPDTITWTERSYGNSQSIYSSAFGNGTFVLGIRYGGEFVTSTDGVNWNNQPSGFPQHRSTGIAFSSGVFVSVGDGSSSPILTSFDGVSWDLRAPGETYYLRAVTAGAGTFVAVGYSGVIVQSDPLIGGQPRIVVQPGSQSAFAGASVSFSVVAAGTSPLSYQWRKNGVPLSGGTNDVLIITNVQPADAGQFTVLVSNGFGSLLSGPAMLTVLPAGSPGLSIASYAGLSVTGIVGRTYRIEYTTSLPAANAWQTAAQLLLTTSPQVWIDFDSPLSPRRFYRAALLP